MTVRLRIFAFTLLFGPPSVCLLACRGEVLDVGASSGPEPTQIESGAPSDTDARPREVGDANNGYTNPDFGTGAACTKGPSVTRPVALGCNARTRPASSATDAGAGDTCATDTDCMSGIEGRCSTLRGSNGTTRRTCSYDSCLQDSDCASGVCGCDLGFDGQNVCLSNSDCKQNGDCAVGQVCARSVPFVLSIVTGNEVTKVVLNGPLREALGYFCTTPQDTCCSAPDAYSGVCTFDFDAKHWVWGYAP